VLTPLDSPLVSPPLVPAGPGASIAKEFKTISEVLEQSHQTVGKLYEETMANELAALSSSLVNEAKKVKKMLASQTAALNKQRAAAQGENPPKMRERRCA